MSSSLVNSLAKVYDPNPLHGQKPSGRRLSPGGSDRSRTSPSPAPSHDAALHCLESQMDSLSCQMERLLNMQQTVLTRLDGLSEDLGGVGRDLALMQAEGRGGRRSEVEAVCRELRVEVEEASEQVEHQGRRLEGVEKLVEGMQQVISFIGEVVKSSRLVELLFKEPGSKAGRARDNKAKDDKDKAKLSLKGLKAQKKRRPPDTSGNTEPVLQEQVEKLNRQNAERSHGNAEVEGQQSNGEGGGGGGELMKLIMDGPHASATQPEEEERKTKAKDKEEEDEGEVFEDSEPEAEEEKFNGKGGEFSPEQSGQEEDEEVKRGEGEAEKVLNAIADIPTQTCETSPLPQESCEEVGEVATCSKRRVPEEDLVKDDLKKSRVEDRKEERIAEAAEPQASPSEEVKTEVTEEGDPAVKQYVIDSSPPPSAPFDHRIVTPKPHQIATFYTINRDEVLGGGRFGQVHKCVENSSGLTLAAKIIKARSQKEKEVVKNEIQVMNQLNHANLIQLYAAFESRHDIILVMEYVDGGELFDRIIDENYNLTELDTVLFIRQICEGLQYMHKMYILHLDLKPENILCVSRATNKIKIIDFGLARRYKPREKLRVNFGTPEFLAPEVINYEFVSFPTDMWSLGVITYMLLSGLSPFLGDDDNETLNNILACQWNFEEEEFLDISEEAKDFITRLLVKSKSWRMSASESLRHPWLSDPSLHYQLHQKKNKCHSTHAPPPES
ncbi:myosin light chain kinase 2, skeletal/cardiac muscle [Myripristis murdjan]|uniref:myosin light chain kinase 2, skeletal/cardiac muscle n=1 Tax=Myripristis murdjan TaxID=586833 RepID=UPI001175D7F2|nr:myosin light chain kinase family member 4 [Myripristis murdjan]